MFQHQDLSEHNKEAGFTLVEALIALLLLTLALAPILWQATNAVKLTTSISNSLIAGNLAQEGIEVVRAIRDTNWFAGRPFASGLNPVCGSVGGGCRVQYDTSDTNLPVSGVTVNAKLKIDPASGLYQYSTGTDSIFSRVIIVDVNTPYRLGVRSTVTWTERGVSKQFMVETFLFDWIP